MERFIIKVEVRSKERPAERVTANYEVLASDCISGLKPFEQTALKMRAHGEADAE